VFTASLQPTTRSKIVRAGSVVEGRWSGHLRTHHTLCRNSER